ncbi:ATP-binding protein [Promicromonospora kroppenstedtii]|uniref:ATP-binding protein n=1 Tax=Promicromonospora kroppenstedtii TaxID=440482 RepID=A0ABW7XLG6_9MICO
MPGYVERKRQTAELQSLLDQVTSGSDRPGRAVLVRGRRRVGKSRLVEEFVHRAGIPSVYFTAAGRSVRDDLAAFAQDVATSTLPGADLFAGDPPSSWDNAFRLLAAALPADGPAIVVLDELPYVTAADEGFEGVLQKHFDRELSRRPVLLVGIGSDLAMMEALNDYDRPFHQRATEMVVPPLSPAEVGRMLSLPPGDAFDAYLVSGGLPLICRDWGRGQDLWAYLKEALSHATSSLLVSAERSLAAEFPGDLQARRVLEAIGQGQRRFTDIGSKAGDLRSTSLTRSLDVLKAKRIVTAERPLSLKASADTRYRIDDPYLLFWLRFLGPHLAEIERGRGDRVFRQVRDEWARWRGRAIEPVVRESVARMPHAELGVPGDVSMAVGGFWNRTNSVEVDLVLADRGPVANRLYGVGSIKWTTKPFGARELTELITHRSQVPGAFDGTGLVVVSRNGAEDGVGASGAVVLGPDELLAQWD